MLASILFSLEIELLTIDLLAHAQQTDVSYKRLNSATLIQPHAACSILEER